MRYFTPCCFSLSLFLVACANESSPPPVSGEKQVTGEDVKQKIGEAADTAKEFTKQNAMNMPNSSTSSWKASMGKSPNWRLRELNLKTMPKWNGIRNWKT